jgi:protein transport protein SEC23
LGDNSDAVFAAGSAGSHAAFPELTDVDAQYLMDQMGGAHVGGADTGTPPVVFVVDESMDDDECAALRKTLLGVVAGMDRTQRVGVVTYAAAVAAYDVSVTTGVATAEVLPGTKSPTPGDVRDLVDGGRVYVAPLEECAGSVDAVLSSLETAVALLRDAMGGVGGGRVVVCASGPATRGPGGVAADEDSELFDFEEKAAKDYVDELSITVSHDDTQLESRPNFPRHARFFLVQHHTEVR